MKNFTYMHWKQNHNLIITAFIKVTLQEVNVKTVLFAY